MVPRHSRDTRSPVVPSRVYFMALPLFVRGHFRPHAGHVDLSLALWEREGPAAEGRGRVRDVV